jgi:hypothetical protein
MQWQEICSFPNFSDSLLCPYILLYDWFWVFTLRVKWPGREAGHSAIPLFSLCAFMAWTGQLETVTKMTVREGGVGMSCWLYNDLMWETVWCRTTA